MASSRLFLFLLLSLSFSAHSGEKTCSDTDGVCSKSPDDGRKCGLASSLCRNNDDDQSRSNSIYRFGGVGQAYKPNVPINATVCEQDKYESTRYKVASWPLSRSSPCPPPQLTVRVNLWSCSSSGGATSKDSTCCCKPLLDSVTAAAEPDTPASEAAVAAVIEIWQARPDGTYSSLRKGEQDDDCRARRVLLRQPLEQEQLGMPSISSAVFETVAPGSTGSLNGLGPSKWDLMPYGPPAIHILVSAPGHSPTLVDVPILVDHKTMEQRSFYFSDWRGAAWVKESSVKGENAYDIRSWKGGIANNHVEIELDIFLAAKHDDSEFSLLKSVLCPSRFYGLSSSFFLEPISVCAPSMLDFFAL